MNDEPTSPAKTSAPDDSTHFLAIGIPLIGILILFVLGVRAGGDVADRGILVLVRFFSLMVLAMSIFTAIVVGLNYSNLRLKWAIGQVSVGFMGLSAGLLWSASAYGSAFISLMVGVTVITLLMFRELGNRNQRRRIGKLIKEGRLS